LRLREEGAAKKGTRKEDRKREKEDKKPDKDRETS
jgi:hypothetical protein